MRRWLYKIKCIRGAPFLLAVLACMASWLLLPLTQQSGGMTEEEKRISATLSRIAGAGETRVAVFYAQAASAFGGGSGLPVGAVIVSKGAGDVTVRLNLIRAAETLLGLTADQVEVFPMENAP